MEDAHRMRITSGGDMNGYVNFALSYLRTNDHPLILHTLPPDNLDAAAQPPSRPSSKSNPKPNTNPRNPPSSLHASTLATPRLVSVVEKLKREYGSELWQYTESGVLPSPPAREAVSLERALSGKTKPKMTHRVYLKITVSKVPLGLERGRNVTCQHVLGVAAAGGAAKKEGAEEGAGEGVGEGEIDKDGEGEAARRGDKRTPLGKGGKRKSDAVPPVSKPVSKRAKVAA